MTVGLERFSSLGCEPEDGWWMARWPDFPPGGPMIYSWSREAYMQAAQKQWSWRSLEEAYVQHWASKGDMMMI